MAKKELRMNLFDANNADVQICIQCQNELEFTHLQLSLKQLCILKKPLIQEKFIFDRTLGEGSQAKIELIKLKYAKKSKQFAVKTYIVAEEQKQTVLVEMIQNEIKCLRALNFCKNIIKLDSVYQHQDKIQLVLKFAKYGSLRDYILNNENVTEEKIRHVMEQLLLAIDLMNKQNIIHRDLKPDNILIMNDEEMHVCIADLGLACYLHDKKQLMKKCGTPGYVDPEVLRGFSFSYKSDIFSLGSLLYNLITGKHLFVDKDNYHSLMKNQYCDPIPIIESTCRHASQECVDLLKKMLFKNQRERPSAEECLQHQWFQKNKESLNNLLQINKQASIYSSVKSNFGKFFRHENKELSFIMGDNYFYMLNFSTLRPRSRYQPQESSLSLSQTPSIRQSRGLPFKLCYNSVLQKNLMAESSKNSKALKMGQSMQMIEIKSLKLTRNQFGKSTLLAKHVEECKEEESPNRLSNQNQELIDSLNSDLTSEYNKDDFDEMLRPQEEVEIKICRRLSISDVINEEKSMAFKNPRRSV